MKDSQFNTLSVPDIGAKRPALVVRAGAWPMRVAVRNIGANLLFFAYTPNELGGIGLVSGVYQLPAAGAEVFVLAPRQGLYVTGQGGGGRVCYAASEAVPVSPQSVVGES